MSDALETSQQTPPTDADPAGTITDAKGQKLAPVAAVIEERRERQAAKAEAERLRQENEALRQKAENFDVVAPYLDLLATHPKITGKPATPPPPANEDPELIAAAEALGFYHDDGTPDTTRAAKAKGFFSSLVKPQIEEVVRPVARTAAQQAAESLRQRAYEVVDKQGRPFAKREHIDAVLNSIPPEAAADPQIINVALMVARGMGVPGPGEATFTEGAGGGRTGGPVGLSGLERAAARARGMSDDQWVKARDAKDDSNLLE